MPSFLTRNQYRGVSDARALDYSGSIYLVERRKTVSSGDYFETEAYFEEVRTQVSGNFGWQVKALWAETEAGSIERGDLRATFPVGYLSLFEKEDLWLEIDGIRLKIIDRTTGSLTNEIVCICRRIT